MAVNFGLSMRTYAIAAGANLQTHIRKYLTSTWLTAFLLSLVIVNSYVGRLVQTGGYTEYVVPPGDRWDCVQPLILLYSAYLVGILAFWFTRPFAAVKKNPAAITRAAIAVSCTVFFNLVVIYLVSLSYLLPSDPTPVVENVKLAVKAAGALSFIVAPINFYYFGMKMSA